MNSHLNESSHVIIFGEFNRNKKYKEQVLQEIVAAICAMLNSNGGEVVIHFDYDSSIRVEGIPLKVIETLDRRMVPIIGVNQTVLKIDVKDDKDCIRIFIQKSDIFITTNYNLYLPSMTQVLAVSPSQSIENVTGDILCRKAITNPVELGSHYHLFRKDKNCGFDESKICQLKNLKAEKSKRTTLADRMTGKDNKFSCYVSAFANYRGGHIYYGIKDDGVVEGEFIPSEKDREEITKKVEKVINKMIWPGHPIGQPRRGKDWEIFFEPVVDENSKPVPSTHVIVIYIAPCLGGVFTEEPECYEMVDGNVSKMSFDTWKNKISRVWLCSKEEIPPSLQRVTWSSAAVRQAFTAACEKFRKLTNNGKWNANFKLCQSLQKQSELCEMKLVVLAKQVTACYRRGRFNNARSFLKQFMTILPQVKDVLIFEVLGLHLTAGLKRATGDFKGVEEALTAALSKAELIEPCRVTAGVYGFAQTVSDLVNLEERTNKYSPYVLSMKTLEQLRHVKDSPYFCADTAQKSHIILATFYLGCNISGQLINQNIVASKVENAKSSIMEVHSSTCDGNPLSKYREVQLKLVQSILWYRLSQIRPIERISLLQSSFDSAKDAESIAREHEFTEMVEWSKANEALFTEELQRAKSQV